MSVPAGYIPPGSPAPGNPPEGFWTPGPSLHPQHAAQGGTPGAAAPPRYARRNGLGTAAMVLGITAIVPGFAFFGIVLGTLAIIFGFVGRARAQRGIADNGGQALAGIITGIIGLILATLFTVSVAVQGVHLQHCRDRSHTQAQYDACSN